MKNVEKTRSNNYEIFFLFKSISLLFLKPRLYFKNLSLSIHLPSFAEFRIINLPIRLISYRSTYDKPSKIARENEENYDGFMNDSKGVTAVIQQRVSSRSLIISNNILSGYRRQLVPRFDFNKFDFQRSTAWIYDSTLQLFARQKICMVFTLPVYIHHLSSD